MEFAPHDAGCLNSESKKVVTTTFTYDNNGNVTQKTVDGTTTTYVYDYANRLTALGAGGATTTYGYDAFGQRVLQTGTTTTYLYPFKWYSVASSTGTGAKYATTTDYVFNGDSLAATVDQQTASGNATGTAKTRYIHPDHLGSTDVVSDENDNLAQTLSSYPYGATRVNVATSTNERRKFIGQFVDDSTLSYLNARYYDSGRGQFMSEDPVFWRQQHLDDPQKLNAYAYGRDNPIALFDISGMDSAYFAAKSVGNGIPWTHIQDTTRQDIAGFVGGEHNYVYFNIDTPGGLSELDIPGVKAQNGKANFTISFEPSNPSGLNSSLVEQVNADLIDAQKYGGSKGHQDINSKDYAKLANDMYVTGSIISSQGNKYNAVSGFGSGYNSNSGLYTIANLNGQGPAYNQLQASLRNGGGIIPGNMSIPMGIGNSIGAFVGTYNFGPTVGTYNFGTQSWVSPSTKK